MAFVAGISFVLTCVNTTSSGYFPDIECCHHIPPNCYNPTPTNGSTPRLASSLFPVSRLYVPNGLLDRGIVRNTQPFDQAGSLRHDEPNFAFQRLFVDPHATYQRI